MNAFVDATLGVRLEDLSRVLDVTVGRWWAMLLRYTNFLGLALRERLDEICRQELDSFRQECGPFSKDQDEMLNAVMSRMTQRIAGSLARELKELPEKMEQEQMATALQRLFHLQAPKTAIAGTIS